MSWGHKFWVQDESGNKILKNLNFFSAFFQWHFVTFFHVCCIVLLPAHARLPPPLSPAKLMLRTLLAMASDRDKVTSRSLKGKV
jgi:hypothetical protein